MWDAHGDVGLGTRMPSSRLRRVQSLRISDSLGLYERAPAWKGRQPSRSSAFMSCAPTISLNCLDAGGNSVVAKMLALRRAHPRIRCASAAGMSAEMLMSRWDQRPDRVGDVSRYACEETSDQKQDVLAGAGERSGPTPHVSRPVDVDQRRGARTSASAAVVCTSKSRC